PGAEYGLSMATGVRTVAAPDFAIDDRRLEGLFGSMVGGRDRRGEQKHEPCGGMIVQVLRETRVGVIHAGSHRQIAQTLDKVLVGLAAAVRIWVADFEAITQEQRFGEQVDDLLREDFGRAGLLVN